MSTRNEHAEITSWYPSIDLAKAIEVTVVVFMVIGISKLLGQSGVIAGFAALLTSLADRPGSIRQRTFGLVVFFVAGYLPIAAAALIGADPVGLLAVLAFTTFLGAIGAGYGTRMAHVGWILTVWVTLVLGFKVWDSIGINFVAYTSGSLLMMVALLVPDILRGKEITSTEESSHLLPERTDPWSKLLLFALVRTIGVTAAGYVGQQIAQFNQYWVALTAVLIMPPALKMHWQRGLHRAVGTVLGLLAGFGLVLISGDNEWLVLGFQLIAAFLLIYTAKKKPYGMFVFFLSIFIVTQIGMKGTETAQAGTSERLMATLIGIVIAFATSAILIPIVRNAKSADENTDNQSQTSTEPA